MKEHQIARYDDVEIEVVAEGEGDLVVLLPSLGRDPDDYDGVVTEFVRRGYRDEFALTSERTVTWAKLEALQVPSLLITGDCACF